MTVFPRDLKIVLIAGRVTILWIEQEVLSTAPYYSVSDQQLFISLSLHQ